MDRGEGFSSSPGPNQTSASYIALRLSDSASFRCAKLNTPHDVKRLQVKPALF